MQDSDPETEAMRAGAEIEHSAEEASDVEHRAQTAPPDLPPHEPAFVNDEPGGGTAEPLIEGGVGEDPGALADEDDPVTAGEQQPRPELPADEQDAKPMGGDDDLISGQYGPTANRS